VNDDETQVQIYESYRDSTAVVDHVTKTFSRLADDFSAGINVDGFVVYGEGTMLPERSSTGSVRRT
jgi:hypothetical protein